MNKNKNTHDKSTTVGIIIIGRNEGENLRRALFSLPDNPAFVTLYVDSGSTDGSVEFAESMGINVHKLDPSRPFSAARARYEGVDLLLTEAPNIDYIQFMDGDCELFEEWIDNASEHLDNNCDVAIVCGHLREREPERSIFNWLSSRDWNTPLGEIDSCGGIFMIRRSVYQATGGFDATLITREEKDLCDRIRQFGHAIVRIDKPMVIHDAGLHRFGQWWQRAVWGGYGDALQIGTQRKGSLSNEHVQRIRRYLTWPIAVPAVAIFGLFGMFWSLWMGLLPLLCLVAYGLLFSKIIYSRLKIGDGVRDAVVYSFFKVLRKFASGYGFIYYFINNGRHSKRPDPHSI